jgi:hypothetical protein
VPVIGGRGPGRAGRGRRASNRRYRVKQLGVVKELIDIIANAAGDQAWCRVSGNNVALHNRLTARMATPLEDRPVVLVGAGSWPIVVGWPSTGGVRETGSRPGRAG